MVKSRTVTVRGVSVEVTILVVSQDTVLPGSRDVTVRGMLRELVKILEVSLDMLLTARFKYVTAPGALTAQGTLVGIFRLVVS